MRRLAAICLTFFAVAVPSAQACDCGGCPPTSCGTTSIAPAGSGLLAIRTFGQHGPLAAYDATTGRHRFSLPAGVLSANGRRFIGFHVTADKKGTLVETFDARTGHLLERWRRSGWGWYVAGVSANGRVIALMHQVAHASRIALVDPSGRQLSVLAFRGWFDVDAVSNDARRLFLIQYLNNGYVIRRYDTTQRRLAADRLTENGTPMNGTAWDAVASADGHRLLTLYLRGTARPEVHALDLLRGTAVCIDLPRGDAWSVQQYTLALSADERTLYAANPALGVVATIDLARNRVVKVVHFLIDPEASPLAPSAVASHDGRTVYFTAGRMLFAYDSAYGVVRGAYDPGFDVAGIAFDGHDRTLLVVGKAGRTLRLRAATGRPVR